MTLHILPPIMCLTYESCTESPEQQCLRLCQAGARWIQIRLKTPSDAAFLKCARELVRICHDHGAVCILNDRLHLVQESGADGVHLGAEDLPWPKARALLGPKLILGGTVNSPSAAQDALLAKCLDYVGIGPLHFTPTKQKLAPVLGIQRVTTLVATLQPLPAWIIGGVTTSDLPFLKAAGATGAAVCSALFQDNRIEDNFRRFDDIWHQCQGPAPKIASISIP